MNISDFTSAMPGRFVVNLNADQTFVPAPLPGRLEWSNELGFALSVAERAVGRLVGIGSRLPNPRIVIRSFLRREAEYSSRIENTFADLTDLALFDQTQSIEQRVPDVREVANNEKALSFGLDSVEHHHRQISVSLIKEMHQVLMQGARGEDKLPGQFRTKQAHIGKSDRIAEARFVPPPPLMVPDLMEELVAYIESPSDLPPLARSAMIHYQFEAIHPFADGNGRIGRVLILMLLCAEKVLPLPILNPSAFLESRREQYYQHLTDVSRKGAWTDWVLFFARGIADEAMDAVTRIARLNDLRTEYLKRLQSARTSSLLLRLIDELFVSPIISVTKASDVLGIGYTSTQKHFQRLLEAGIMWEISGRARNRLYFAGEIVQAIEGKPLPTDLQRRSNV